MKTIFLSPHLDDAVFSCGGLISEQVRLGVQVEVWTFCTSDPIEPLSPYAQMLHERWQDTQNPTALRREEDIRALSRLGCHWRHLGFPDCIYRLFPGGNTPLITKDADLFQSGFILEEGLIKEMSAAIMANTQPADRLCIPLGVGGHIDHRNTRIAAERCAFPLFYYADFPYAAKEPEQVLQCLPDHSKEIDSNISPLSISTWQDGVACYRSQISSFWPSEEAMRTAISEYAKIPFASKLWQKSLSTN